MKIEFEVSEEDAALVETFFRSTTESRFNSHGPLNLPRLAMMLLEDVALMVRRPGSWEGSNMAQVLGSHGYEC